MGWSSAGLPSSGEGDVAMVPMKPEPQHHNLHLAGTLSLDQLARRWKTTRKEIRRLLGREELGFVQIRGRFRVSLAEVKRYERSHPTPA